MKTKNSMSNCQIVDHLHIVLENVIWHCYNPEFWKEDSNDFWNTVIEAIILQIRRRCLQRLTRTKIAAGNQKFNEQFLFKHIE